MSALTQRGSNSGVLPNKITIYRRPLIRLFGRDPDRLGVAASSEDGAALERQESRPEVRQGGGAAAGIAGSPARANDLRRVGRPGARLSAGAARSAGHACCPLSRIF